MASSNGSAGVLIAMQGNPNFELAANAQQRQAFNRVLEVAIEARDPGVLRVVPHSVAGNLFRR